MLSDNLNKIGQSIPTPFDFFKIDTKIIFTYSLYVVYSIIILFVILFAFHLIRVSFDKISKKTYFLKISFNKQINYNDARYLQTMDNLFKRLEQTTRRGGNSISLEVCRCLGVISFKVGCSDSRLLDSIKSQLEAIEGIKIELLPKKQSEAIYISRNLIIKKVFFKDDSSPIHFKTANIFADIVHNLERSDFEAGCVLLFRSSKARNRILNKKRRFDKLSKDPKRNDQCINQEKSKLIEQKLEHGELMNVKIYTYSENKGQADNLVSTFSQSSLNSEIRSVNVFLTLEKNNINRRYIAPEFVALRLLLGYSYLNSYELAHIFRPVFSEQLSMIDQNIVSIPEVGSKDLLLLNAKGDSITIEDSKNGIGIFGDKGSGKTSGALGNLIISSFNNGEGALFTIYKDEEVYPILKLAKQNNRTEDIILLNRDSLWRTNIINEELKQTKSVDNVIDLMIKINGLVNKTEKVSNTQPFWDNEARNIFSNLVLLTLFLNGVFSFVIFEYLSELMSESARFFDVQGIANLTPDQMKLYKERESKKLTFEAILKFVEEREYKSEGKLFAFTIDDVNKCIRFFKIDWLGNQRETREGIYATFSSNIRALQKGIIPKLLIADVDESYSHYFTFGDTRKGKIIILDEPISLRSNEGKVFQKIIKSVWIDEIKRNDKIKPSNLISDEYQELVTEDDIDFLNVCRSYGVGVIWATQNIATLEAKIGKDRTKQLLANTQVKIFHQSSDPITWKYGRELLGEVDSNNYTEQYNEKLSTSISSSQKYELLGKHFQQLSMNLPNTQTEAIIFNRGYNFEDGKLRYLEVIFNKVDRVFADEIESIIPKFEQVNLPTIDAAKVVKNLLLSEAVSDPNLKVKIEEVEDEKNKIKTSKKLSRNSEEIKNLEDNFLSLEDCVKLFNVSTRSLRNIVKELEIKSIDSKSENNRNTKMFSKNELTKYFKNRAEIARSPMQK